MKKVFVSALTAGFIASVVFIENLAGPVKAASGDATAEAQVRKATDGFYSALNEMFTGDVAPMIAVWSHSDEVTDFGPLGNRSVGWKQVEAEFRHEASLKLGGRVATRDMIVHADDTMGYVTCIEHGENLMGGGKSVGIDITSTSILRREGGGWKLVHHHTDIAPKLKTTDPQ